MKVAVCVATYRRPVMLAALLDSIARLRLISSGIDIVVVVVDNDVGGSARETLERWRSVAPWPLVMSMEPTRNIALARNRCLELALNTGADWIAFVDDDEQVSQDWLAELLRVQRAHGADIVAGRVVNAYHEKAPRWMVEAGLPISRRRRTGEESPVAQTSNVLIGRPVFAEGARSFDVRFGLSGGSDSHFFLRARRAGARIVWADDAIVYETLPPSRATAGWLLRRSFRIGNASVFVARAELPVYSWLPRRLAAAAYRVARGVILLFPAFGRGRAAIVMALQDVCVGVGALTAMAGYRYIEYEYLHGA